MERCIPSLVYVRLGYLVILSTGRQELFDSDFFCEILADLIHALGY